MVIDWYFGWNTGETLILNIFWLIIFEKVFFSLLSLYFCKRTDIIDVFSVCAQEMMSKVQVMKDEREEEEKEKNA